MEPMAMEGDQAFELFERLAATYLAEPEVTAGSGFGSTPGLRIRGHIFAMFVRGGLVVKLPSERVAALIASGKGQPFGAGKDRPMREWVLVSAAASAEWPALMAESRTFVGGE